MWPQCLTVLTAYVLSPPATPVHAMHKHTTGGKGGAECALALLTHLLLLLLPLLATLRRRQGQ